MMMIIIIIIIIIINLPLASTCYIKPENETGAKRESKKDKENWKKNQTVRKKERCVYLHTQDLTAVIQIRDMKAMMSRRRGLRVNGLSGCACWRCKYLSANANGKFTRDYRQWLKAAHRAAFTLLCVFPFYVLRVPYHNKCILGRLTCYWCYIAQGATNVQCKTASYKLCGL